MDDDTAHRIASALERIADTLVKIVREAHAVSERLAAVVEPAKGNGLAGIPPGTAICSSHEEAAERGFSPGDYQAARGYILAEDV